MRRIFKLIMPLSGKAKILQYTVLGILSGLCSFLFINLSTRVVQLIIEGNLKSISSEYILVFASIILLFIWTRRSLSLAIIHLSQKMFWNLRTQIISQVLKASFRQLLTHKSKIYSAIVNDVNVLTNASLSIIEFSISAIVTLSCFIYLASISLVLFSITLGTAMLGVIIYQIGAKKDNLNFERTRNLEDGFIEHFNSILNGFKEIFMDPKKGRFIFERKIKVIANEANQSNIKAFTGFLNNQMSGQVLFYILVSSILLFFSVKLGIESGKTVNFIFILLYVLSSLETIMVLLPNIVRAKISADRLLDLKTELEDAGFSNNASENQISRNEFSEIAVQRLEFYYEGNDQVFGIGPIDFTIEKGETVFIYGGNGSGKTTLIHSILGLCRPTAGEILLNGIPVDTNNYSFYKTAFAVVFNDFYLFTELIGPDQIDMEKWYFYLRLFELEDKVKMNDRSFSTTDLSTGQRKRLALIAALLEEKPILVLDEWAADQDPYFRKKFYTEIIPLLKAEGVTIIAITHDDKYYHCADKLYKMDYGKLRMESVNKYESISTISAI